MLQVISNFLGAFLSSYTAMYIASKISSKNIDFKNIKFWLISLVYCLYIITSYLFSNDIFNILRIFLNCIVMMLLIKWLTQNSWIKTALITFSVISILVVSEFLCMLLMVYGLKIESDFLLTDLVSNIIICMISIFFINLKQTKYKFQKLIDAVYIKKIKV